MKKRAEHKSAERGSSKTEIKASDPITEPPLEHETIATLAYYYWEARGCPYDSPHEDWFRAEDELRNRLAAAATA
jgi:hypothetical protein